MLEITPEQIERRDFSIATVTYWYAVEKSPAHPLGMAFINDRILVGSPFKPRVYRITLAWAVMRHGTRPHEINIYPRNYIQDARRMRSLGQYIQAPTNECLDELAGLLPVKRS